MKATYAAYVKVGEDIESFFIVKAAAIKTGSTGKQYFDLSLGDVTGDLNAKKWDVSPDDPEVHAIREGDIVKIRGQVTEFNGQKQVRVQRIRRVNEQDDLDYGDFIKSAPEDPEQMYGYLLRVAQSLKDAELQKMAVSLLEENKEKLLYYPAAARNHHAERGGLLWHTKRMAMMGQQAVEIYPFLDRDLLLCGVLFHDMEKINEILSDEQGIASDYSEEGKLLGHLVMGVREIEKRAQRLGVSHEKALLLEHMVLTHHYEPEFGSPKKPMFAEAELLHYLDILDARMFDFEEAALGLEPGTFSEKIFALDNRRIYKPNK